MFYQRNWERKTHPKTPNSNLQKLSTNPEKNNSDKGGGLDLLIEDSDNNKADVLSGPKTIDENKSTEETPSEE